MAKREIPLFIIDNTRNHKRGECDFLVCTDKDKVYIDNFESLCTIKRWRGVEL